MLTIPYVTQKLGPEKYGFYSLALNWIIYFHAIVTYGFDMVGSKYVAQNREDHEKVERYVNTVVFAKLLLTLVSAVALALLIVFAGQPRIHNICLVLMFGSVFGETFKQTWLFQGLETMKNITVISSFVRIISTICVFLFVDENGLFIYCILYSVSGLLVGIIGALISHFKLKMRLVKVSFSEACQRLKEGFLIFTTNAMSKIFTGFGVTVLGVVSTTTYVGIYSAIYKVPTILISCFSPISQVLYPNLCLKYQKDYKSAKKLALKVGGVTVGIFVLGSAFAIAIKDFVVNLIFGEEYIDHSMLLIPFMIWLCLSIANNFLGTQILIAGGHTKEYSVSFIIGTVSLVVFTLIFGSMYKMYGIAFAQVLSEATLLTSNAIAIFISERKLKVKNVESNTVS